MKFYSSQNKSHQVLFDQALRKGLAPDGGLYCPEYIPQWSFDEMNELLQGNRVEVATEVLWAYTQDVWSKSDLENIVKEALDFDIPLRRISDQISILELFHGPTEAFKDVGARFMARALSHVIGDDKLTILVATSGDTGSAVADGFWNVEGIDVVILFPKDGVSAYQESQMTTLGDNIYALEVEGTFDDCQDLVKQAFQDPKINKEITLSSANSINIGRLLPQSLYYYFLAQQLDASRDEYTVCVPSGNFGNLTSGFYAQQSGLQFKKFIAATNANKTFPDYLHSGEFHPKKSVATLSNAMDVGKPSNFERLMDLFDHNREKMRTELNSTSISDKETLGKMREINETYDYILDPHTAVGWCAIDSLETDLEGQYVILGTAHPKKFERAVKLALPDISFDFGTDNRPSKKVSIKNDYAQVSDFIQNGIQR